MESEPNKALVQAVPTLGYDVTRQPITFKSKRALQLFNKGLTEYVLVRDPFYPLFEEALLLEDGDLVIVHSLLV